MTKVLISGGASNIYAEFLTKADDKIVKVGHGGSSRKYFFWPPV